MKQIPSYVLICFFALSFCSPECVAIVDMKNANYGDTWTDAFVELGQGLQFKIQRTYNSRTLYDGMFGFGWCSDLETTMQMLEQDEILVTSCGAGQKEVFRLSPSAGNGPKRYYNDARSAYVEKTPQGYIYATGVALTKETVGEGCPPTHQASIEYDDLRRQRAIRINQLGEIEIGYAGFGREIDEMRFPSGEVLTFRYYSNGKVAQISSNKDGESATYQYDREGNLIKVKNFWNNTYLFRYDQWHNLTRIEYSDNTFKELTYDVERDWVTSFRNRDGCLEKYEYFNINKYNYYSLVTQTCQGKIVSLSRYSFSHDLRSDGRRFLSRVSTNINGVRMDISYHPFLGMPMEKITKDFREVYTRGENGNLTSVKIECDSGRVLEFGPMGVGGPAR